MGIRYGERLPLKESPTGKLITSECYVGRLDASALDSSPQLLLCLASLLDQARLGLITINHSAM